MLRILFTLALLCASTSPSQSQRARADAPAGPLALVVQGEGPGAQVSLGRAGRPSGGSVQVSRRFVMNRGGCTWSRTTDGWFPRGEVRRLITAERAGNATDMGAINLSVLIAVVGPFDIPGEMQTCYRQTIEAIAAGRSPLR